MGQQRDSAGRNIPIPHALLLILSHVAPLGSCSSLLEHVSDFRPTPLSPPSGHCSVVASLPRLELMTTAHRPTWVAAQGAASDVGNWSTGGQASQAVSSWDLPSQTTLKFRKRGQNSEAELRKRDVRAEVEDSERRALDEKPATIDRRYDEGGAGRGRDRLQLLLKEQGDVNLEDVKKYDDADDADSGDDLDSSDSDDDSDDDEEALEKELEKIRKEREEARKKKEREEAEDEEKRKQEAAMTGNILLTQSNSSSQVKRRWNDDVVFKGQARTEPETKKRFVNDTIRNDFHRRFLTKYIK